MAGERMTMEKIRMELAARITDMLSIEVAEIDLKAPLHTLGLDSMRMVEMLVFVETQYGVDLMATGLQPEDIASVSALARTIDRKQGE